MLQTTLIQARIDTKTKRLAERILAPLGLTPADATRLFFHQIVIQKDLPIAVSNAGARVPNAATIETMSKSERGEDLERFDNVDALIKSFKK